MSRAHRGHRLGLLLKIDMMRWLAEAEPQLEVMETWNNADNRFMIGVNELLGYRLSTTYATYELTLPPTWAQWARLASTSRRGEDEAVTFPVPAEAYGRFMGRFSEPLAAVFADACGVRAGQRVLDVGCGPGALTAELVRRLGPDAVTAIDPSPPFVAAAAARFPRVDVRTGTAENLPFADDSFDVALAQLVVHFMADPVQGLARCAGSRGRAARSEPASGTTAAAAARCRSFWRAASATSIRTRPGRGRPRRNPRGSAGRARARPPG